jgi:hypothetical protein
MGHAREKLEIAEVGKHTPILGGENASAETFVTHAWPLITQLKQLKNAEGKLGYKHNGGLDA